MNAITDLVNELRGSLIDGFLIVFVAALTLAAIGVFGVWLWKYFKAWSAGFDYKTGSGSMGPYRDVYESREDLGRDRLEHERMNREGL